MNSKEFNAFMNCPALKCAMLMPESEEIIKFHRERNDNIIFITSRSKSDNECITKVLEKRFKIKDIKKRFIFNGKKDKSLAIKNQRIDVFYGNSNADMLSAIDADALAIRVQRSDISTRLDSSNYTPGEHGEIVISR